MKRYLSIFLVLVALLGALTVPVKAAETDTNWMELLDYGTVNYSGSNSFSFTGSDTAYIPLPYEMVPGYIDAVIYSDQVITGVTGFTLRKIDSNYYRIYGLTSPTSVREIGFTLKSSSSSVTNVNFLSVRMSAVRTLAYPDTGFLSVDYATDSTGYIYMSDASSAAVAKFGQESANPLYEVFQAYVYLQNWTKYDSADVYLKCKVGSINSISARLGSTDIPFEIGYLNSDTGDWIFYPTYEYGSVIQNAEDVLHIVLHLDLSNLDRTSTSYPVIYLSGKYLWTRESYVSLMSYSGHVNVEGQSAFAYWMNRMSTEIGGCFLSLQEAFIVHFKDLNEWIVSQTSAIQKSIAEIKTWLGEQTTALVTAIKGDSSAGDSFKQELEEQTGDIDEMADVMDSVTIPDLDTVDVSVDEYVSVGSVSVLAELFDVFLDPGGVFGIMVIMSILMATVSFILFGKR